MRIRPVSRTCAISYDDLRPPIFRYYPANRHKSNPIGYNLKAVLDAIHIGNKLEDPCTREPYSRRDLVRMDLMIKAYGLSCASPLVTLDARLRELENDARVVLLHALRPSQAELASLFVSHVLQNVVVIEALVNELQQHDPSGAVRVVCELLRIATAADAFAVYTDYIENVLPTLFEAVFVHIATSTRQTRQD